jgi:hypothetical protein
VEESYTQAAGLCWRWKDIVARNGADRHLTAVLYERDVERASNAVDAVRLLKKQEIAVARLDQLPKLARKFDRQKLLM